MLNHVQGMDFLRPGLKTGVGNGIFWSEIGSGFAADGRHTPTKNFNEYPPGAFCLYENTKIVDTAAGYR